MEGSEPEDRRASIDSVDRELDLIINRDSHGTKEAMLQAETNNEEQKVNKELQETEKGTISNEKTELNGFHAQEETNSDREFSPEPTNQDKDNDIEERSLSPREIRQKYDTPYPRSPSPRGSPKVGSPRSPPPGVTSDSKQPRSSSPWSDEERESLYPGERGQGEPNQVQRSRLDSNDSNEPMDPDDDLGLTDDQRQAMRELSEMKLDLAYTAEEDPPEYDVTERVRQLNQQLAEEPPPNEDERERKIVFKENLVDLVAPPPEYSDEEDEDQQGQENEQNNQENDKNNQDPNNLDVNSMNLNEQESSQENSYNQEKRENKSDGDGDAREASAEEKILVERNGKFQLLDPKDLTAEERMLYNVPEEESEENSSYKPAPPNRPRPNTANGGQRRHAGANQRRTQSAMDHRSDTFDEFTYKSPYAMTEEVKEKYRREHSAKMKREREQKEKEKKEKEEKEEESEEVFNAWCRQKQLQAERQKKEDREKQQKKEEDGKQSKSLDSSRSSEKSDNSSLQSRDPDGAYKEWVKLKRNQSKEEKNIEDQRQKEIEDGYFTRPRGECDKAYKKWLRKKSQESAKQKQDDKQKARISKLLARRSRKSQQLAKAIRESMTFRYVDYYGYRY